MVSLLLRAHAMPRADLPLPCSSAGRRGRPLALPIGAAPSARAAAAVHDRGALVFVRPAVRRGRHALRTFTQRYPMRSAASTSHHPRRRPMSPRGLARCALTPEAAARRGSRMLVHGGIHAANGCKDAGSWPAPGSRWRPPHGALEAVLVFVPVFTPRHERFGAWNRPNHAAPMRWLAHHAQNHTSTATT